MRKISAVVGSLVLFVSAGFAQAQWNDSRYPTFQGDFGLGYSRLRIDGANAKGLDKGDGAGFQAAGTWNLPGTGGFRLGFGLSGSSFYDDFHAIDTNGDEHHLYNSFTLISPEVQIAYYLPIHHFFIEPKLGVGLAVADYSNGHIHHDDYFHDDEDRVRCNAEIHPGLQIGYQQRHWAVGVEGSYLYTHMNFGQGLGGDISTWYAGVFGRWQF